MPQEFYNHDELKLEIVYSIKIGTEEANEYTMLQQVNLLTYGGTAGTAANQGFFGGKKYTYILTFKLDKIYFNPQVTDWTAVAVTEGVTVE